MTANNIKQDIYNKFFNYLTPANKYKAAQLINNNFYKYIGAEILFQFFVVSILEQENIFCMLMQNEGRKSNFEGFLCSISGYKKGCPDLFLPEKKVFFELKKSKNDVFLKNGNYKKSKHINSQVEFLQYLENIDYYTNFLYPENFDDEFDKLKNMK